MTNAGTTLVAWYRLGRAMLRPRVDVDPSSAPLQFCCSSCWKTSLMASFRVVME